MKVKKLKKVKVKKSGLKLNIQKTKIMASGPITSWQIDEKTVADFIFWGSKITADMKAQVGCMRQVLGPGALGRPRGMGWGGRWEGGSGWGIHVNPWLIHVKCMAKTTIIL